jgi:hypothetical protein
LQSDFAIPEEAKLPREMPADGAGARPTRIVMTATWIMLVVIALICAIGPHIPSGE